MIHDVKAIYIGFLIYRLRLIQAEEQKIALNIVRGKLGQLNNFGESRFPVDQMLLKYGIFRQI